MFTNFQSSTHRRYLVTTRELRRLCKNAGSVEEMALFWCVREDRSILVSKIEGPHGAVNFAFYLKKRLIGSVIAYKDDLLKRYPEYSALDETLLYFADQEGARPNDPWFEERSKRLQIVYSLEHEINCAPAYAMPELVLSYVLSSAGYAEIRCVSEDKPVALQIGLIFLGEKQGAGWTEDFRVRRKELLELVSINKRSQPTFIH